MYVYLTLGVYKIRFRFAIDLFTVAAQSWLLCRLIPFMVGEHVPEDDLHWLNYLLMLEITDILFAPEISLDEVGYLKILIEDHHSSFCSLYPHASVIPKMHYIIHTPQLIQKYVMCSNVVC